MASARSILSLALAAFSAAACASSSSSTADTGATPATMSAEPPSPDPRIGLRAGLMDAEEAAWNMRKVSTTPPADSFVGVTNSDLAFLGNYVIQGNYNGYQVWDVSNPARPTLKTAFLCPASQSDVSIYKNLLFVSGEGTSGRLDCGTQGVQDTVSADRLRGIRIFDATDIANPKYIANVQTCRGSHTHTVVTDPDDKENVYIYVSGSAGVRSPSELPGCSRLSPDQDPNSALFRIEVIKVPLANPQAAAIVSQPRIFQGLTEAPEHGDAPEDIAAQQKALAEAKAAGAYTATIQGREMVIPGRFTRPMLDSIVKARNGTGAPTAADSAALRTALPDIIARMFGQQQQQQQAGPRPGPSQCHDITVYPAIGLAGGACGGYGLLLDISDAANPRRIDAVADSNFSYWHSATFSNDGDKVLFSDEWGGGGAPKCRATDKKEWGANAIFTLVNGKMVFQSYYKMPAAQTSLENCVAHNGSLIPVPGREIMVQAWYQGGISVFEWTDPANPKEIAFFDRGPVDSTEMGNGGAWSSYWYNGYIYSSEIGRGLDVLELTPSAHLSQNEIDAAKSVKLEYFNAQQQPKFVWPASFAVVRSYVDQLERSKGLSADRIRTIRNELAEAEKASGSERRSDLTEIATAVTADATASSDRERVEELAKALRELAGAS
ncbi:MAG TPA: hypothetical protein VFT04_02015 [Gemmatimonadales bacterium]|nr:hypothetical protein [Gemmatimonadales bacterium]